MATTEDYKKYFCALGSRSVRRLTASVEAADLSRELRNSILVEAHSLLHWQRCIALVDWPFERNNQHSHEGDDDDECDEDSEIALEVDFGAYADGHPVSSTVDWDDGFATIVHHPAGLSGEPDVGELSPEIWPCGHRPGSG